MDVVACIPLHHQQYGLAGCSMEVQGAFPPQAVWMIGVYAFHPSHSFCKCRTVPHPVSLVTEWKRMQMPKQIRYRQKSNGMLRYWTGIEMSDAEMPMPVASALMPMPSSRMTSCPSSSVKFLSPLVIAIRWLNAIDQDCSQFGHGEKKPGSVLNDHYLISSSYELKLSGDPA